MAAQDNNSAAAAVSGFFKSIGKAVPDLDGRRLCKA